VIGMAIAGALGAMVRYLLELIGINAKANTSPWLTLLANAIGSFLVGTAMHSLVIVNGVVVTTNELIGFCGGLTTFSSAFAVPLLFEKRDRAYGYFLIFLTPALCAGAFFLGLSVHN